MVGIRSYGVYLPAYKLDRKAIANMWDFPKAPGTKSIANQDEDAITMAIAAGLHCFQVRFSLCTRGGDSLSPRRDHHDRYLRYYLAGIFAQRNCCTFNYCRVTFPGPST